MLQTNLTGQRVQHHVETPVADHGAEFVLELARAEVADVVVIKTHRAQRVPLAAAGGGEHPNPKCRASCTAAMPTPPVPACSSNTLTRLDVGQDLDERVVGGGENG